MTIIGKIKSLFKTKSVVSINSKELSNTQKTYDELKGEIRAEINRIKRE